MDSQGTIYIVYSRYDYQDASNGQFSILLRKSEDNGANFDKQTVFIKALDSFLTEENFTFFGSDIKIKNDDIFYVWSGSREIFLARGTNTNGGSNFEVFDIKEGQITNDVLLSNMHKIWPSVSIDSNNNVHVIWFESNLQEDKVNPKYDLYSAKLENKQNLFSESKLISKCDNSLAQIMLQPSIVTTSTDTLFIVWNKPNGSSAVFSNDGGETFSESIEITFGMDGGVQNRRMVVDQNDELHFLYLSASNGTLHYTKSSDLCNSFDKSLKIGTISAMADMHLDEKKKEVYVVWEDPQKSGIYFSRSVETTDENMAADSTSESAGGGSGSVCFIHSALD